MSDIFGELRSLLQRPPEPALWYELQAFFDATRGHTAHRTHLEYAQGHIARWPARWCALDTDHMAPELARALLLDAQHTPLLEMWLCDPAITHIELLSLGGLRWTETHQDWLEAAAFLPTLSRVEVLGARLGDDARFFASLPNHLQALQLWRVPLGTRAWDAIGALLRRAPITALEVHDAPDPHALTAACDPDLMTRLHLTGGRARTSVEAIALRETWPALEVLDLRSSGASEADLKELARRAHLPALRDLWVDPDTIPPKTLGAWPGLRA